MLTVKEKGIMLYIIEHCERIITKTKNISQEEFDKDKDIREIICFNLLQIGELAKNLSSEFNDKYNKVPWKKIKGMRDVIAHGYTKIDMIRAWGCAITDVPYLKQYCEWIIETNEN